MKSALHITAGYAILRRNENQEARWAEAPDYDSEILTTEGSFRLDKKIVLHWSPLDTPRTRAR
jgi:hypothetical protein